jgi:uncharacterized delta-60 repeat protein
MTCLFTLALLLVTNSVNLYGQSALDGFNPNANGTVTSLAIQSDGKILVGGQFTQIGGQTRSKIARLNPDGSIDSTFNPNASNIVYSLAIQSDGKIVVGGRFTQIDGQTRNYIARLTNDTAALNNFNVYSTYITFVRNGAAPLFDKVTFEYSTNGGATYTSLGTAFPQPVVSGGLAYHLPPNINLPTGQNLLVRARGFYKAGMYNGSYSIEEHVKQVYFFGPTAASVSIRGRVLTAINGGIGLSRALVLLTDGAGNVRIARTNTFGYFRFDEVEAGDTYVLTVSSKRYQYDPRVLFVTQELTDLEIYPVDPQSKTSLKGK